MGNLASPDGLACAANDRMPYDSREHLHLRTRLRKPPNLLQCSSVYHCGKLSSPSYQRLAHPMKALGMYYVWSTPKHLNRIRNILEEGHYIVTSAA